MASLLKETIEFALAEFATMEAEKHKTKTKRVLDVFIGSKSNLMGSMSNADFTSWPLIFFDV